MPEISIAKLEKLKRLMQGVSQVIGYNGAYIMELEEDKCIQESITPLLPIDGDFTSTMARVTKRREESKNEPS